jgi:hypothetical protein
MNNTPENIDQENIENPEQLLDSQENPQEMDQVESLEGEEENQEENEDIDEGMEQQDAQPSSKKPRKHRKRNKRLLDKVDRLQEENNQMMMELNAMKSALGIGGNAGSNNQSMENVQEAYLQGKQEADQQAQKNKLERYYQSFINLPEEDADDVFSNVYGLKDQNARQKFVQYLEFAMNSGVTAEDLYNLGKTLPKTAKGLFTNTFEQLSPNNILAFGSKVNRALGRANALRDINKSTKLKSSNDIKTTKVIQGNSNNIPKSKSMQDYASAADNIYY